VYLLDARDGQKGLGVSVSRSQSLDDGFEQTVIAQPSARHSPQIASVADGYTVLWLEHGQVPEALMHLALDGSGQPLGAPTELARTDAMQFSLASSPRTLAIAATARAENDWLVTIRLVTDSAVVSAPTLDFCTQQSSAPAVVWDGSAFDVVYVCSEAGQAGARLKLARVSEAGEVLGAPRVLDTEVQPGSCPSLDASFDRGALSLVYVRQSQSQSFAAFFARVDPERETPPQARSLEGTVPPGRLSVAATPTGYQVLSSGCAPGLSSSISVNLYQCALDAAGAPTAAACRSMPTSSSVPRATALIATSESALLVYDEYLFQSHPGVFVVELPSDPLANFFPVSAVSPAGELSHRSLVCAANSCRLQSFRGQGRFRSAPPRAIEYGELGVIETLNVDLDSGSVERHVDSRLLPARTAKVVQSEPNGLVALLDVHAFDAPPAPTELVALTRDLTELWSLPLQPGDLFAEAGGVRSFINNSPADVFAKDGNLFEPQHRNRKPGYDLALCNGAYYDIDAERRTIYRLEPRDGAQSLPFASLTEGRGWLRCTNGMVCALTNDETIRKWSCWDHAGKPLPGAVFPGFDSRFFNSFNVELGPDLGLALIDNQTRGRITLTRLRPNGSTTEYELLAPSGLEFGAWTATGNAQNVYLAWNDPVTGDTFLSRWKLP
jgi:hypothetical protein